MSARPRAPPRWCRLPVTRAPPRLLPLRSTNCWAMPPREPLPISSWLRDRGSFCAGTGSSRRAEVRCWTSRTSVRWFCLCLRPPGGKNSSGSALSISAFGGKASVVSAPIFTSSGEPWRSLSGYCPPKFLHWSRFTCRLRWPSWWTAAKVWSFSPALPDLARPRRSPP